MGDVPTWYLVGAHIFLTRTMHIWDKELKNKHEVHNLNVLKRKLAFICLLWSNKIGNSISLLEVKSAYLRLCKIPWEKVKIFLCNVSSIDDITRVNIFEELFPFDCKWFSTPSTLRDLQRIPPVENQQPWYFESSCVELQNGFKTLFEHKIDWPVLKHLSNYKPSYLHFSNLGDFYEWFCDEPQLVLDDIIDLEYTSIIHLGSEKMDAPSPTSHVTKTNTFVSNLIPTTSMTPTLSCMLNQTNPNWTPETSIPVPTLTTPVVKSETSTPVSTFSSTNMTSLSTLTPVDFHTCPNFVDGISWNQNGITE